MVRYPRIA